MKLLKINDNYADEFDVFGFAVYSDEKYKKWLDLVYKMPFPQEMYFGSNEYLEWDSPQELLSTVKVVDICDDAAKVILGNLCYDDTYGTFIVDYDTLSEQICQDLSDEELELFDIEFYPEECEA